MVNADAGCKFILGYQNPRQPSITWAGQWVWNGHGRGRGVRIVGEGLRRAELVRPAFYILAI